MDNGVSWHTFIFPLPLPRLTLPLSLHMLYKNGIKAVTVMMMEWDRGETVKQLHRADNTTHI